MDKFIFVAFFMLLYLFHNVRRKGGWVCTSSLLLTLWASMAVLSIPTVYYNLTVALENYQYALPSKIWKGCIAFVLYILLFLFPFTRFRENKIEQLVLPNLKILNTFSSVLIVLSIYSIIYYLPSVIGVLSFSDLSALRDAGNESEFVKSGILNTIASVGSSLYPFVLLMFFIYYSIGGHKIRSFLLIICSFSNVIHVLTFVGRDGVVFWLFNVLFMYSFFKDYLGERQQKIIKKTLLVGAIVAIIPFLAISISRFILAGSGIGGSLVSYMGQMAPNYAMYYEVADRHYNYGSSFPLFWEITGQINPKDDEVWVDGGTTSNVFSTFIRGFNTNFGLFGTVVVGVIMALFFMGIYGTRKRRFYFYHFFIYILYWAIFSEGVFYFKQYTRGGNLFFLMCIGLQIYFCYLQKKIKSNFVLMKRS